MENLRGVDPGQVGGFRLLRRLGAGGMGAVYLGRDVGGGLAAVKVLLPELTEDPDFRVRFEREVAAARRLHSPWIAQLLDADAHSDRPWLATVFMPGPALAEAVAQCGPLPVRAARVLGGRLAEALAAVHEAGLVHRDVKPGNVLLALDGPRLIDFGIASAGEETALTAPDLVIGTPGFLAPEQARGETAGPPADVFALGALLVFALSGRGPFGQGSSDALLYRTVHDEPELRGVEDESLRAFLARCLDKEPERRPAAADVATALSEDAQAAGDWLPDPVVRLIADRTQAVLELPDAEAGEAGEASGTGHAGERDGRESRTASALSRRRLLRAGSGAAVLALGAGGAAWAVLGRDRGRAVQARPAARRWVLGVQADLTGARKAWGTEQERGVRLAVEQFNTAAARPFTITLTVADDAGDIARAMRAAQHLAADPDLLAVVGSTTSETRNASLQVYDAQNVTQVSVSAIGQDWSVPAPRAYLQAAAVAGSTSLPTTALLANNKITRVGVLIDRAGGSDSWQFGYSANLYAQVAKMTAFARVVPRSATDPTIVLADLLGHGPGALYYTGTPARAALVAKAVTQFSGDVILDHQSADQTFLQAAGPAAEGWQVVAPWIDGSAPQVAPFAAAYRTRYGTTPGPWAAEAYDVARMILDGLVKVAPGRVRPAAGALFTHLSTHPYQGLTRTFSFKDQRLTGFVTFLYQVHAGAYSYLGPAPSD